MKALPDSAPDTTITADVLVVGGGTAGAIAALAAGEEGARVCLIEAGTMLGGTGTAGGVHNYYYGTTGGVQDAIDDEVGALQKLFGGHPFGFHPEAKRMALARRLAEAGVQVIFGAMVYEVLVENRRVGGVRAVTPTGMATVRAHVTIDSTGDGDVAAGAGATYSFGRRIDGLSHQYSLVPRLVEPDPRNGRPRIASHNFDAGVVRSDDPLDVTRALLAGRQWLWSYFESEEDDEARAHVLNVAPHLGVREGRHIVGDYVLTFEEYLHGRPFADAIALTYSHYDNHARDLANEPDFCQVWLVALAMCRKGVYAQVPYRSLLPRGLDGLLVACRALSVDREVSMAVRMQRDMQKVGEAAGVAAALAVAAGCEPRSIPIAQLQERLLARGTLSPDDPEKLTRNFQFRDGPLAETRLSETSIKAGPRAALADALTTYLGGEDEGKALWWLSQLGDEASASLNRVLKASDVWPIRRAAAFGLGMLRSPLALPVLRECFLTGDPECPPPEIKTYPRWVAALIFLRLLGDTSVLDAALARLHEPLDASLETFLLAYVHDSVPHLGPEARARVAATLRAWIADPARGTRYAAQKSGGIQRTMSLRWNVELWVARILERCGDPAGRQLVLALHENPDVSVRIAAQMAETEVLGAREEQLR